MKKLFPLLLISVAIFGLYSPSSIAFGGGNSSDNDSEPFELFPSSSGEESNGQDGERRSVGTGSR